MSRTDATTSAPESTTSTTGSAPTDAAFASPLSVQTFPFPLHANPLDRFNALAHARDLISDLMIMSCHDWLKQAAPLLRKFKSEVTWEYGDEGQMYKSLGWATVVDAEGRSWDLPTGGDVDWSEVSPHDSVPGDAEDWPKTHLAPAIGLDPTLIDQLVENLQACAYLDDFEGFDFGPHSPSSAAKAIA